MFSSAGNILLLAFGFGFVIFFHELGHFLAAKWADVKVEQFAVGFGQALVSWRKGLGIRWGSSQDEYQRLLREHIEATRPASKTFAEQIAEPTTGQLVRASLELGISETEYRLNWIPLGGYVKMLGQDDLRPNALDQDPRAYNNKPISKRMVIVSAGVVMNVILAFVGFMTIFRAGFKVQPAMVGSVLPGSPAQQAFKIVDGKEVVVGLQPGDQILYLNDRWQSDFDKIKLNTLLLTDKAPTPIYVRHADQTDDHLIVTPTKSAGAGNLVLMGIMPAYELRGLDADDEFIDGPDLNIADFRTIKKGDRIVAINGQNVQLNEFWKLDQALQDGQGAAVGVTVEDAMGTRREAMIYPRFEDRFGPESVNFAGMMMRPMVQTIRPDSKIKGTILPGDVVVAFSETGSSQPKPAPTVEEFMKIVSDVGQRGAALDLTVLRDGKITELHDVKPAMRISPKRYGLGISLKYDEQHPVVAGTVEGSVAQTAGVPNGAEIKSINGQAVSNWFDVNRILMGSSAGSPLVVMADVGGKEKSFDLGKTTAEQIADARQNRLISDTQLVLHPAVEVRKTNNILTAAAWGVGETRDTILQVYQTVRAMVTGSIGVDQVSGPVGILAVGYKFAEMGLIRLTWFLSIISANLAVMNFLPIPIVDGGLFTFLIIEKLKGGPISPRVQTIAQVVGLAILLSVFLFATYQDVFNRLPFLNH